MKLITYNNETHTLKEWIEILKLSDEVHRDFVNDDLIEFAKEIEFFEEISNEQLYTKYRYWCEDSGHNALARNTFLKRIAKAFKEYRNDVEAYRTSKERGYETKFIPCDYAENPFG